MKYKKIILFLLLILLTGCTGNYNLTINEDSSINEEAIFQIEDTDDNFDKISNIIENNNISKKDYKLLRNEEEIEIKYTKTYITVEDYVLNSKIYKQIFDEIDIEKTKSKTTLSTSADFRNNSISINNDNNNYLDYLQINVISNLPVISDNSDTSNDNVYTWVYNKNQLFKNINFSFRNTPKLITVKSIIILSGLLILTVIVSIIIYRKIKHRDRF